MKKQLLMGLMTAGMIFATMNLAWASAEEPATSEVITEATGSAEIDVTANIGKTAADQSIEGAVYRVEVNWSIPTLTATQNADKEVYMWDAENTKYVLDDAKSEKISTLENASSGEVSITITNKSNATALYEVSSETTEGYSVTKENTENETDELSPADQTVYSEYCGGGIATIDDLSAYEGQATSKTFKETLKLSSSDHLSQKAEDVVVQKYTVTLSCYVEGGI